MAITESDYAGRFTIPTPKGIHQAAGDTNVSTNYAYRAENIRTERGLLASGYGTSRAFPSLGAPIETLTRFYRRTRPDDADVFVAAANGSIYTYTMGTEGWVKRAEGFLSNRWSYVTYEVTAGEAAEGGATTGGATTGGATTGGATTGGATVDVLIMSNAKDGMIAVYGSDLRVERKALAIGEDYAGVKFAVLCRHAERIWGAGAEGYPDSVFYSRPYDPFTWTGISETPELGGGVIDQPTWDGDSFIALAQFGGYLLAMKPSTIFEIRGTDPGSFTISEAYGTDGALCAQTIGVDRLQMIYLARGGLGNYDGSTLSLLSRDALYETMRLRMPGTEEKATACVSDHVYYLALCVRERGGDVISENNTVIEYDTERGTFMLRTGIRVKDFFALGGEIYYTDALAPYDVYRYGDPESGSYLGTPIDSVWETGWLDLGKEILKRDFVLRFTADADQNDVPLEISLMTNRREKTKVVLLQKERRDYRVKIQLSGVRVRLRIRGHARAAGWRIYGGVQVDYTVD